MPTNS